MPWFGLSKRDHDDDDDDILSDGDYYNDENNDDDNSSSTSDEYEKVEEGHANRSMIIPSLNSSRSSSGSEGDEEDLQLSFRPLQPCDRQQIQELHEQWFPVTYSNEFYNDLVNNHRLATSGDHLFTCVATVPNTPANQRRPTKKPEQMQLHMYCQETQSTDNPPPPTMIQPQKPDPPDDEHDNSHEIIVGCVVGAFLHPSRLNTATQQLLVPTPQVHSKLFYIMTLGTVEEYRGYGVATSLVQKCMELVQSDPTCGALYLHVIPFNRAAIRFYEKLGFYRTCAIENYYNIHNQQYDCFLYAKYFHGNRGHRTLYKLFSGAMSSLWHHLKSPFSIFSNSHH
ncbi:alpha-acetyltransferase 60 [Seminavis robusta]|uniref:N-alpha-acetyltransferase 60 n=1 Tax=Seminavis robusta TaxID=568900 RepID=A0A9N8HZC4_9STRA|nr:alpha-acetyltransferase 60 [Seminavis robusta]|eukprot:Sro2854_g338720.1 alpha-acetyltransferase 60 (340) ;mRNA; r:7884-9043